MSHPADPDASSIRSRLLKVLRLAQQGVGGERENAEVLLAKLLKKHGLTMADLEGAGSEAATLHWMSASDAEERTVLSQLAVSLVGTTRKLWTRTGSWNVGLEATASEHAALSVGWEVYRAAFVEARQALVLGFCLKHDLYAAEGGGGAPMSEAERDRARRALALSEALPAVDSPRQRLGGGQTEEQS
jgi:hypothetical protein